MHCMVAWSQIKVIFLHVYTTVWAKGFATVFLFAEEDTSPDNC